MLRRSTEAINGDDQKAAFHAIQEKLFFRLIQKGTGACGSIHEASGVITEEYGEFLRAVESNDDEDFIDEVLDIAVAAVWVLASVAHNRSLRRPSEGPGGEAEWTLCGGEIE